MYVFQFAQTMLLHYTGQKIVYKIREDVFVHIQSLSHHQFNEIPVGTLVTRDTSDINVLFQLYTNVIVNLLKNVATIIGVFVAMMLLNAKLALIVLAILPIILVLTIVFRKYSRRAHRHVRTEVSNMNAFLSENISGMKITQIFNQEEKKLCTIKVMGEGTIASLLATAGNKSQSLTESYFTYIIEKMKSDGKENPNTYMQSAATSYRDVDSTTISDLLLE
jgi:ABC-type multidrug transport system fused ATPase/permease subunit